MQFVLPSQSRISDIRIQFIDLFNNSQTTLQHLYYSITETTIVGRLVFNMCDWICMKRLTNFTSLVNYVILKAN